jgi:hypothetical protein
MLFDFYIEVSVFKQVFIKSFYKFLNIAELNKVEIDKYQILAFYLIYNNKTNVFQIMAHYRAPLVLVCIISYYITYALKIGI